MAGQKEFQGTCFPKTIHQAKQLSTEQRISSDLEAAQCSPWWVCSSPSPAVQRALSCKKGLRKLKGIFIKPSLSSTQLLINSIAVHVLTCLSLPIVYPAFQGFTCSSWGMLKVPAQCTVLSDNPGGTRFCWFICRLLYNLLETWCIAHCTLVWYKHSEITRLLGQTTPRKECKESVSIFFLLLMFAEVIHTNWNLAWCMHASILKWLINQLKPLKLILKIQIHAMQVVCTDFRADTQPHATHYSPLRHHRGSSEQVCNTNTGFQERNSCRVGAACPKVTPSTCSIPPSTGVFWQSPMDSFSLEVYPKTIQDFTQKGTDAESWSYMSHPGPSQVGKANITAGTLGIRKVAISRPQTLVNQ